MCAVADESCIGEFGLRVSETEEILVFINDGGESCDALLIRNCFAVVCKVFIDRNECFDCGIVSALQRSHSCRFHQHEPQPHASERDQSLNGACCMREDR